jgi:hypothetical protein
MEADLVQMELYLQYLVLMKAYPSAYLVLMMVYTWYPALKTFYWKLPCDYALMEADLVRIELYLQYLVLMKAYPSAHLVLMMVCKWYPALKTFCRKLQCDYALMEADHVRMALYLQYLVLMKAHPSAHLVLMMVYLWYPALKIFCWT